MQNDLEYLEKDFPDDEKLKLEFDNLKDTINNLNFNSSGEKIIKQKEKLDYLLDEINDKLKQQIKDLQTKINNQVKNEKNEKN